MKIVIDNREHTLAKLLKALNNDYEYNIPIEVKQLDLGDIAIHLDNEEIIILERKNLSDLASSIRDGRYAEQSYRLNGHSLHNHNIIYIIEGNISRYSDKFSKIKPETLYVTMFCLQYFKGFSVFRTMGITETAEYILRITDKLRREKNKYGFYHSQFVEKAKSYTNVVKKVKEGQGNIVDLIKKSEIDILVNTTSTKREILESFSIRRTALIKQVPYFTTIAGALAAINAIDYLKKGIIKVKPLQEYTNSSKV